MYIIIRCTEIVHYSIIDNLQKIAIECCKVGVATMDEINSNQNPEALQDKVIAAAECISAERLNSYARLFNYESHFSALIPYMAFQIVAGLFYPSLHLIEVCLRNRVYTTLRDFYQLQAQTKTPPGAPEDWLKWMPQNKKTRTSIKNSIDSAKKDITYRQIVVGDVISRIMFGTWINILDERPDNKDPLYFFQQVKSTLFPNTTISKAEIKNELIWANSFRNRIFHHEAIWRTGRSKDIVSVRRAVSANHKRLLNIILMMSKPLHTLLVNDFHYEQSFDQRVGVFFDICDEAAMSSKFNPE